MILILSMMIAPTTAQDNPEFVVTYALPYDFSEHSQFTSQSYATEQWLSAISAGLYSRSSESDRNYEPELADGFPVSSADGLVHVVILKNNLMFSDGTPLTAEDVVFTYQSLLNPEINFNTYATYSNYFDSIDSIKAIDESTIEFSMNERFSGFMTLLSAGIQPKAHFEDRLESKDYDWNADDGSDAISAGPFKIATFDHTNMQITMIRNPFYWNSENVVSDVIIFKKIGEKAAAISALENREIQIFDGQYVASVDELDAIEGIEDILISSPVHFEIAFNHLHPYYGSGENLNVNDKIQGAKKIRKAISHIIDRETAVDEIMEGMGIPLATIVPVVSYGWNPDIEPREYSISKAKELMMEAGLDYETLGSPDDEGYYKESFFNITFLFPSRGGPINPWVEFIPREFSKIGIGISEVFVTDWGTIIPRTFGSDTPPPLHDEGGYDIFQVGYGWGLHFNPYGLYESYNMRPDGGNIYNFNNVEYDDLSEKLHKEFDMDKRFDLMQEIQEFYYEWEIVAPIISPREHWAFSADLRGYDAVLLTTTDGGWDEIGTQEAIDAMSPFGSFLDFGLFSLIIPFLIISVFSYSIKNKSYIKF